MQNRSQFGQDLDIIIKLCVDRLVSQKSIFYNAFLST